MSDTAKNALSFVLILCVLLTLFSLSSGVLAADSFLEIDVVYAGQSASGLSAGVPIANNGSRDTYAFKTGASDVYCFCYPSGSNYVFCFVSDSSNSIKYGSSINSSPNTLNLTLRYNNSSYYNSTNIAPPLLTVPSYPSRDAGLAAFESWTPEPDEPPAPPVSLDYTLPPGNIAYIPIPTGASENITYTLTTTYYMAFGNNDTSRINQVVTVYSTLPSSSNNIAPSSPKIPWTNNGNVNLLGVSANKIYNGSIPSNLGGQFLVVANPLTMPSHGGSIGGDTYINGSITIHVSNVGGNPYIYPMSESLTITVGDGIGSESTYGYDPYTYVTDPDTGEIIWTDPNGGDTAPVSGGNNPLPSPNTIFDWLRNISQQLADFLRGPVQAVQTVVSAIRDFLSSFTQLYMWLPSPVYSLITSALMIAITIGVIKIFV